MCGAWLGAKASRSAQTPSTYVFYLLMVSDSRERPTSYHPPTAGDSKRQPGKTGPIMGEMIGKAEASNA